MRASFNVDTLSHAATVLCKSLLSLLSTPIPINTCLASTTKHRGQFQSASVVCHMPVVSSGVCHMPVVPSVVCHIPVVPKCSVPYVCGTKCGVPYACSTKCDVPYACGT